jgi:hypothetical protein
MNVLLSYFWPIFGAGLIIGVVAGSIGFRVPKLRSDDRLAGEELALRDWRRRRLLSIVAGAALSLAAAALWHGPLGAADRFTAQVAGSARLTLDNYGMTMVTAHLHRDPLTRRLLLSGHADEFQRSELARILGTLPGVSSARWTPSGGGTPLIAEAAALGALGFLLGLLLAYLVELRRRYNSQWTW